MWMYMDLRPRLGKEMDRVLAEGGSAQWETRTTGYQLDGGT